MTKEVKETIATAEVLPKAIETLDFSTVNGYMLMTCEKKAKEEDPAMMMPAFSMAFKAQLISAVAGCKVDDVYALPGDEFMRATNAAQRFLLQAESTAKN